MSMTHMLPSVVGNNSAPRDILTFEALLSASHMTPVYASDLALPQRLQDSVPVCLLRL